MHTLTLLLTLSLSLVLVLSTPLTTKRQNSGCYCGTITGLSCGARTSTGLSLSGDCNANTLYNCTQRFGNAQPYKSCLLCDEGGQDGFDSCDLGLGSLLGIGLPVGGS